MLKMHLDRAAQITECYTQMWYIKIELHTSGGLAEEGGVVLVAVNAIRFAVDT